MPNIILVIALIFFTVSTVQNGFGQDKSLSEAKELFELERYESSFKILKQLESKSEPEVLKILGDHFNYGLYVEEDINTALTYYKKAAAQNHIPAILEIGLLHEEGVLGEEDLVSAYDYFLKARDLGSDVGSYFIALYFQFGLGVEQDIEIS